MKKIIGFGIVLLLGLAAILYVDAGHAEKPQPKALRAERQAFVLMPTAAVKAAPEKRQALESALTASMKGKAFAKREAKPKGKKDAE